MIHKGIVFLSIPVALAAAWFSADWPETEKSRVRGTFRRDRGAGTAQDAPEAALPTASPKSDAPKPEPAKPEPVKPEPPKPRIRTIEDLALPVSAGGAELTFPKCSEIHVDLEGSLSWHGAGEVRAMKTFKMLGEGLRQRSDDPLVLVADAQTPWQTVRYALLSGQDNYAADAYLGVAAAADPKTLRVLRIPQTPRSDAEMPAGDTFTVAVKAQASGAPEIAVAGTPLADPAKDLPAAWEEWKKAHPEGADTKDPVKTRVVLDAPRSTPIAAIVAALDVLRAAGIESERYAGDLPARPK